MSRALASALSTALVALIALAAWTQELLLVAAAVLLVQALVAAAPSPPDERGRNLAGPRFVPAIVGGLVATVIAFDPALLVGPESMRAGREGLVSTGIVAGMVPAIAAAVFVALVAQMVRRDGRPAMVVTTGHAVALSTFAVLASAWIGAARSGYGVEVVTIGAAAIVAGLLVWSLPLDSIVGGVLAVLAGALAGAGTALLLDSLPSWVLGVAVGSAAALFAVMGQVLGRAWTSGRRHSSDGWGFPGALAVALPAPVVFVGAQLAGLVVL